MKKYIFILVGILFGSLAFGQVGINTENPQQLFHSDGKKDNPQSGVPNAVQELNDIVLTEHGELGLGVVSPTRKLDVNGDLRIRMLPTNGSNGFIGTKTVVADDDGVLGVVEGLPAATANAYSGYYLTDAQGLVGSNMTPLKFNYNQIIGSPCPNYVCPVPNSTNFGSVYTLAFDKKSLDADKYLFLTFDYNFRFTTRGNITPIKGHWVAFTIQILINGTIKYTYSARININAGATVNMDGSKSITIDLTNFNLQDSNNTLEIRLPVTESTISINAGTGNGNYATGANQLLTISVKDLAFFFYEK